MSPTQRYMDIVVKGPMISLRPRHVDIVLLGQVDLGFGGKGTDTTLSMFTFLNRSLVLKEGN